MSDATEESKGGKRLFRPPKGQEVRSMHSRATFEFMGDVFCTLNSTADDTRVGKLARMCVSLAVEGARPFMQAAPEQIGVYSFANCCRRERESESALKHDVCSLMK